MFEREIQRELDSLVRQERETGEIPDFSRYMSLLSRSGKIPVNAPLAFLEPEDPGETGNITLFGTLVWAQKKYPGTNDPKYLRRTDINIYPEGRPEKNGDLFFYELLFQVGEGLFVHFQTSGKCDKKVQAPKNKIFTLGPGPSLGDIFTFKGKPTRYVCKENGRPALGIRNPLLHLEDVRFTKVPLIYKVDQGIGTTSDVRCGGGQDFRILQLYSMRYKVWEESGKHLLEVADLDWSMFGWWRVDVYRSKRDATAMGSAQETIHKAANGVVADQARRLRRKKKEGHSSRQEHVGMWKRHMERIRAEKEARSAKIGTGMNRKK